MPPEVGARTFDVLRKARPEGAHRPSETIKPGKSANP